MILPTNFEIFTMNLDAESTLTILLSIVALLTIYIRQHVVLKSIQTRQDALEIRMDKSDKIIDRLTEMDKETKEALNGVQMSNLVVATKLDTLLDRLSNDLWKK